MSEMNVTDIENLIEPEVKDTEVKDEKPNLKKRVYRTNIPLLLMVFVIVVFGLIVLYSVSGPDGYNEFGDSAHYLKAQVRFTLIGLAAMFFLNFVNLKRFCHWIFVITAYGICLGLALATRFLGYNFNGARRWIQIGGFHLQTSEIIKVLIVFCLAGYRMLILDMREKGLIKKSSSKRGQILSDAVLDFIIPITAAILVDLVIVIQPHLSCFIIVAIICFLTTLSGGIHIRSWVVGGLIIAVFAGIVGTVAFLTVPSIQDKITSNFSHVFKRIAMYNADEDEDSDITEDDTRQIDNAHNALGSGGMWGVGLGESRSKYNYISEAQNDYIFSVYVEETGFVGGAILIMLYIVLFMMCSVVIWKSESVYYRMIATGCSSLIFVEALLNLSVELQIIPSTGITLPFVSYGGTAQIMLLVAIGFILSVSRSGTIAAESAKKRSNRKKA